MRSHCALVYHLQHNLICSVQLRMVKTMHIWAPMFYLSTYERRSNAFISDVHELETADYINKRYDGLEMLTPGN